MFHNGIMGSMWFWWLFWIIIIAAIIFLSVRISSQRSKNTPNESALDILKKRYANGEITKDEYEKMKDDLK